MLNKFTFLVLAFLQFVILCDLENLGNSSTGGGFIAYGAGIVLTFYLVTLLALIILKLEKRTLLKGRSFLRTSLCLCLGAFLLYQGNLFFWTTFTGVTHGDFDLDGKPDVYERKIGTNPYIKDYQPHTYAQGIGNYTKAEKAKYNVRINPYITLENDPRCENITLVTHGTGEMDFNYLYYSDNGTFSIDSLPFDYNDRTQTKIDKIDVYYKFKDSRDTDTYKLYLERDKAPNFNLPLMKIDDKTVMFTLTKQDIETNNLSTPTPTHNGDHTLSFYPAPV